VASVRTAMELAGKEDTLISLLERKEATEVAALLSSMHVARGELEAFIAGTPPEQLIRPRKDGWSLKDHLFHLAIWDRYLIAILERQPRLPAVGIDTDPLAMTDHANSIFQERGKNIPLNQVLTLFRANRGRIIDLVQKLNDADLDRPIAEFQPNDPEAPHGTLRDWILPITADHDRIHHQWMKELLAVQ